MSSDTLVVLSLEPWDGTWRRNQYLVDGLLRADASLRVVFVEPARDLLHDLVSRRRPQRGSGKREAEGYDGRLTLLEPTKWLPRLAGPAADALLRRSLRSVLRKVAVGRPLLWINDPGWAHLVDAVDWPALYDMTDDWLVADRSDRARDRVVANEEILMGRCTSVVVCSPGLFGSRRAIRDDVVLIPNAVDVNRYRRPTPRPDDLPDEPTALYVGTLHEDRLDVELVLRTAGAMARLGGSVVLVGPDALSEEHSSRLRATPGIRLLGARGHEAVPAYLQHAGAVIVPHVVTPFTESLDPIKRYEYLAVGRPLVSTPVAGFRELAGELDVTIVAGAAFPDAVARAARQSPTRSAPVEVPDWSDRVRAMAEQIDILRTA